MLPPEKAEIIGSVCGDGVAWKHLAFNAGRPGLAPFLIVLEV